MYSEAVLTKIFDTDPKSKSLKLNTGRVALTPEEGLIGLFPSDCKERRVISREICGLQSPEFGLSNSRWKFIDRLLNQAVDEGVFPAKNYKFLPLKWKKTATKIGDGYDNKMDQVNLASVIVTECATGDKQRITAIPYSLKNNQVCFIGDHDQPYSIVELSDRGNTKVGTLETLMTREMEKLVLGDDNSAILWISPSNHKLGYGGQVEENENEDRAILWIPGDDVVESYNMAIKLSSSDLISIASELQNFATDNLPVTNVQDLRACLFKIPKYHWYEILNQRAPQLKDSWRSISSGEAKRVTDIAISQIATEFNNYDISGLSDYQRLQQTAQLEKNMQLNYGWSLNNRISDGCEITATGAINVLGNYSTPILGYNNYQTSLLPFGGAGYMGTLLGGYDYILKPNKTCAKYIYYKGKRYRSSKVTARGTEYFWIHCPKCKRPDVGYKLDGAKGCCGHGFSMS